ncbi:MAG: DUF6152 family protein [Proteobacteria bacterium]|nr:DUF6152 family protein [Pseudomonadota bacterium]MDA0992065.1 DUF6152 family protein [Pseudomonadota bacterium]
MLSMNSKISILVVLVSAFAAGNADAHHSRSNYNMDEVLEYDGTVVEFKWSNPHAFAVIEVVDETGQPTRLLLEMNSKIILSSMGWSGDTLAVGDTIHVSGNPDKRADRKQLFVAYVIGRSGERMWSFGRPPEERARQEKGNPNPLHMPAAVGSTDFSGIWNRARVRGEDRPRRDPFAPADLPLTEKGKAAVAEFDPNDDPSFECLSATLPRTIVPVLPIQFTWVSDDLLTIRYQSHNVVREVHMGKSSFPANVSPGPMGYSIGRMEENELVIDSKYFTYDRWGNGRGVPSGEQKEVQERYSLTDDGKVLSVTYTVADPEYLTGVPVEQHGRFVLRNNMVMTDYDCDPDAATRHLTGQ